MAQFYTLEEAARVLGMSAEELKLKAQHREVRAFLDGGSWQFRKNDIDEYARQRGMGSDPDLSLSDVDLEVPDVSGSGDIDLSEFQLGVVRPDTPRAKELSTDDDILLDDMSLPPAPESSSSSTIIGMKPAGKKPSDSDVRLVPESPSVKGASDSDVRLASVPPRNKFPSDSDVTIVSDSQGSSDEIDPVADDPGATTLRKSPMLGSSAEVEIGDTGGDSDFELTPSSVIDALQPESGSDFELTALDASDEFDATPRSPSDSDVTASEPSTSGINLGRPSDSGINLSGVGGFDFSSHESIELAPLDDDEGPKPPPKKAAPKPAAAKKPDLSGETALPIKGSALDPSATALPIKSKGGKDIFEDTDFEVDALDSGQEDQTVQLEAASDFDLDDGESASEVFALDEDEVDENAATAMGPASLPDDDEFSDAGESTSGETDSAWGDVESADTPTPSQAVSTASRAATPALSTREANVEWGAGWVSALVVVTVLMILLAFVNMDLIANLYTNREGNPIGHGLISWLSGLGGGQ